MNRPIIATLATAPPACLGVRDERQPGFDRLNAWQTTLEHLLSRSWCCGARQEEALDSKDEAVEVHVHVHHMYVWARVQWRHVASLGPLGKPLSSSRGQLCRNMVCTMSQGSPELATLGFRV